MDVTITQITEPDALYCRYQGQHQTQPVVMSLDLEDGELTALYNPEIGGGIPASVYHHRTIWIEIPPLTAPTANQLMESVKPLAQRILNGATIEWDGNNHVGQLDDDAHAALDQLTGECAEENFDATVTVNEFTATDWFVDGVAESIERLGLTADSTDAELERMAAAEEEEVRTSSSTYGYTILVGALDWLHGQRAEMRDAVSEELATLAEQLVDMEKRRNEGVRRLASWGGSSRAIGALVGLSHTRVQQIAKEADATAG